MFDLRQVYYGLSSMLSLPDLALCCCREEQEEAEEERQKVIGSTFSWHHALEHHALLMVYGGTRFVKPCKV